MRPSLLVSGSLGWVIVLIAGRGSRGLPRPLASTRPRDPVALAIGLVLSQSGRRCHTTRNVARCDVGL